MPGRYSALPLEPPLLQWHYSISSTYPGSSSHLKSQTTYTAMFCGTWDGGIWYRSFTCLLWRSQRIFLWDIGSIGKQDLHTCRPPHFTPYNLTMLQQFCNLTTLHPYIISTLQPYNLYNITSLQPYTLTTSQPYNLTTLGSPSTSKKSWICGVISHKICEHEIWNHEILRFWCNISQNMWPWNLQPWDIGF